MRFVHEFIGRARLGPLALIAALAGVICPNVPAAPPAGAAADLIVRAGRVWTGDPKRPWAEAIAIRGGAIVAVGDFAEVARLQGAETRLFERPTAFAMPGLIDAHGHIASLGSSLEEIDLRGITSVAEIARKVKDRIEASPGESWIIGRNWDQTLWPGGRFPTAWDLDEVAPVRPVWLTRVDGHAGWANSDAMWRAGITERLSIPPGGQMVRDAGGNPTGVFVDGAMGLIEDIIPSPTVQDIKRRILKAQDEILRAGLTGVHDAGLSASDIEAFRQLDRERRLVLRIYGMASVANAKGVAFVSNPPEKAGGGSRFELRAIKLFIDGAMGSRGGLLFEPYNDDPQNSGLQLIEPAALKAITEAALRNGWQVATHAIGDRGNALVLDAYEQALKAVPRARDPRLRIEHAQVVRKSDVDRFAAMKIVASMQPSHASDDMRWAEARVGSDRVKGAYAWRWFLDAKVPVAFGSDFPVEIVSPFWGIYAGLTRQDPKGSPSGGWHPEHRLTVEEALRGFTAGAAHAAFAEDRLGALAPGLRADITLIDRDPFQVSPREVLESKILATIVEGKVVFEL